MINKIGGIVNIIKSGKIEPKKNIKETSYVSNKKDEVTISKEAMDFQTVMKAVKVIKELPDVREDIVSSIKEKVDKETYNVSSRDVAEKLLKNSHGKRI